MMIPEAWENDAAHGRAAARVLPVPRLPHGAVGRPGQRRVHRRHGRRRGARPQRAAPRPLVADPRRPGRAGQRGRRARPRPVRRGRQGPARSRAGCSWSTPPPAGSSRTTRSRRSSPPPQPYEDWLHAGLMHLDDLPEREHVVYTHDSVQRRQQTFGYTEEELKILLGADGPHRRRAARLDGHGHADRRADQPAAAAVRLLHPALRAGHQPAAGRDPRGAGHQRGRDDRARRATCSRPARRPAGRSRCRTRCIDNDELAKIAAHRRRRRPARLPGRPGLRPLPGARRRDRAQGPAGRDHARRLRGDRGRRAHPRAVRPRLHRRPGADPVAAAHRGRPPAPGPRADPHPGVARRRVAATAARCTTSRCCSASAPSAVNPYLAFESVEDLIATGALRRHRPGRRRSATTSRRSARAS